MYPIIIGIKMAAVSCRHAAFADFEEIHPIILEARPELLYICYARYMLSFDYDCFTVFRLHVTPHPIISDLHLFRHQQYETSFVTTAHFFGGAQFRNKSLVSTYFTIRAKFLKNVYCMCYIIQHFYYLSIILLAVTAFC